MESQNLPETFNLRTVLKATTATHLCFKTVQCQESYHIYNKRGEKAQEKDNDVSYTKSYSYA